MTLKERINGHGKLLRQGYTILLTTFIGIMVSFSGFAIRSFIKVYYENQEVTRLERAALHSAIHDLEREVGDVNTNVKLLHKQVMDHEAWGVGEAKEMEAEIQSIRSRLRDLEKQK